MTGGIVNSRQMAAHGQSCNCKADVFDSRTNNCSSIEMVKFGYKTEFFLELTVFRCYLRSSSL
jgi:hypothetical protein